MATAEKPTPPGPGYWRDRAREAWTLAARLHDLEAKSSMISIAKGYDRSGPHGDGRLEPANRTRTHEF